MISEEMLRARKRRTELGIKKYKDKLLKTSGLGERKTIELRIAEDKAALKRIEEALKKVNIPGKHYSAKIASTAPTVKKGSSTRRKKPLVKKDLFSLK